MFDLMEGASATLRPIVNWVDDSQIIHTLCSRLVIASERYGCNQGLALHKGLLLSLLPHWTAGGSGSNIERELQCL